MATARTEGTARTALRSVVVLAVLAATSTAALAAPATTRTAAGTAAGTVAGAAPLPTRSAAAGPVVDPRPDRDVDPRRARAAAEALRGPSRLPGRPADVLRLHSDPTAQRTVFLDFDGAYVVGTQWQEVGLRAGTVGGWDPAENGAALSGAEADVVYETWVRVAEDFAPFGVDVTTQRPVKADIERVGREDKRFGTAVVVTTDPRPLEQIDGCDGYCGGVAFYNAFAEPDNHSYLQPAFVMAPPYEDQDAAVFVAEAASHEVGHALGLKHDDRAGDDVEGYYAGHNPWAPIMGTAYDQPVSQWSRGDFARSTNTQDDVATIVAKGAPRRRDDVGATPATATPYAGRRLAGTITSAGDVDLFRLDGCAGAVSVKVDVAAYGANLDVGSTWSDAAMRTVGYHDTPVRKLGVGRASGLGVTYREELPAGPATYYVSVDGVGKAGTTPTNGYDDYGSLGRYTLTVYGCGKG